MGLEKFKNMFGGKKAMLGVAAAGALGAAALPETAEAQQLNVRPGEHTDTVGAHTTIAGHSYDAPRAIHIDSNGMVQGQDVTADDVLLTFEEREELNRMNTQRRMNEDKAALERTRARLNANKK